MVAVEPDRAICDCFGSLSIWAGDCDVVWSETFLELSVRGGEGELVYQGDYWYVLEEPR